MRFVLLLVFLVATSSGSALAQSPLASPGASGVGLAWTVPINRATQHGASGPSRRALLEMSAVALTGVGHLAFSELDASAVYIPLVMSAWGGYVYHRARTEPEFLREIGFTSEGLGGAFRDASLLAGGALALMAAYGAAQGSLALDADMIPLLALYPAWGLVQQLLVQGFVAGNLADAPGWSLSPYVVTPVTAAVFASVHLPNLGLTAGTFALGLGYTPIYLRHRNLWPLGLYHGWLGVFYYFWFLEQNPWRELFE
jgi:uncharacterized protein